MGSIGSISQKVLKLIALHVKFVNAANTVEKTIGNSRAFRGSTATLGSTLMDFITQLPVTKSGFDSMSTFVDRFSKGIY